MSIFHDILVRLEPQPIPPSPPPKLRTCRCPVCGHQFQIEPEYVHGAVQNEDGTYQVACIGVSGQVHNRWATLGDDGKSIGSRYRNRAVMQ